MLSMRWNLIKSPSDDSGGRCTSKGHRDPVLHGRLASPLFGTFVPALEGREDLIVESHKLLLGQSTLVLWHLGNFDDC